MNASGNSRLNDIIIAIELTMFLFFLMIFQLLIQRGKIIFLQENKMCILMKFLVQGTLTAKETFKLITKQ